MLNPPLNRLIAKVNSKCLITATAAKRVHELDEKRGTALLGQYHLAKPIGKALEEIADGKIEPVVPREYLE